jgi:hypothetical protein
MAEASRARRNLEKIAFFPFGRMGRNIKSGLLSALASFFVFGIQAAHANSPPDNEKPERPPVLVKLCSTFMDHETTTGPRCPNGAPVRRTLLVPYFVNPKPRPIETWKVGLTIYLTDDGLKFLPQALSLERPQYFSDHVWLAPGWSGLFRSDLARFTDSTSHSDPDHNYTFAWDRESDPDFEIFSALGNTQNNGYPKRVLVPKTGGDIFFQCFSPVVRDERLIDSLCSVRDYTGPQHDALEYSLNYSRLKDWRRYSKSLWDYIDSITVKDTQR